VTPLVLSTAEIMVMCSLLCSSDVIAAVSMISAKDKPKLFSTVFGEGIMNDAVCIILFNVVVSFAKSGNKFTPLASGIITA
jgi:NhaP-type Na+/H+ or K+/H+ antiporter